MSLNSGLNPNVVLTELDTVFFQEYERVAGGSLATALTPEVFNQSTAENSAVKMETFSGISYWPDRDEEENVFKATPRIGNAKTYTVKNYASSIDIPKHFWDDDMHSSVQLAMRDFADKAAATRDRNAMKFYVDGFATNVTADDAFIFSNSHTTLSGDTVDNLDTAALSPTALDNALVALMEQKDQAGVVRGKMGRILLVPPALYKQACELSDSQLRPNTGNNEPNVFLTKYGLQVLTSPYLSAAATISGADAYWYVIADNHAMTRWTRQSVETNLVPYEYSANNVYTYKGEFREVIGCQDYVGLYASNGTT